MIKDLFVIEEEALSQSEKVFLRNKNTLLACSIFLLFVVGASLNAGMIIPTDRYYKSYGNYYREFVGLGCFVGFVIILVCFIGLWVLINNKCIERCADLYKKSDRLKSEMVQFVEQNLIDKSPKEEIGDKKNELNKENVNINEISSNDNLLLSVEVDKLNDKNLSQFCL